VRAAICYELDQPVRVEEVTLDPPRQGEVRVRMAATGVCHSDLSVVRGVIKAKLPCVLGHEGAGVVEEVGEGVTHLAPGDKVVLSWVTPCGRCFHCRLGEPHLCDVGTTINRTNRMPDGSTRVRAAGVELNVFSALGALAEQATVPASAAVKLPADAPLEKVALLGCAVTTGVGAVFNTARVTPGSRVAVFGCGGVGLNAVQGAAIAGAASIVAVDVNPAKLEHARVFGATAVVDAGAADAAAAVRDLTEGRGADFVFEAVGRKETIETALAATRRGGTCVVMGVGSTRESASLNVFGIPFFEKRLVGSWFGSSDVHRDIPRLYRLYRAGRLKLDELVSRTYALDEVNRAFADLSSGANARGVVVFPGRAP
jgi:S-(hydroxymethyl)glutathione dehydrogenase/alcohol dehydrogenase